MAYDLDQWRAQQKARSDPKPDATPAMRRAALHAEHLTGDPHWDYYQSILQAWLDVYEQELEALKDGFVRVDLPLEEARAREARAKVVFAKAGLLRDVMSIPGQLKEGGRAAADRLQDRGPEPGAA